MTLNNLLKVGSLFGAIKSIVPFEFFTENTPEKLDSLLDLQYGDRELYSKVVDKTLDELAVDIITMYQDEWRNAIKLHLVDFEINSGTTRKLTEETIVSEDRLNDRDDLNKVSAYNDDALIVNDGATSKVTDTLDGNTKRILTEEKLNLNNAYTNLSLLTKNNIIKLVLKDVSNLITISIY